MKKISYLILLCCLTACVTGVPPEKFTQRSKEEISKITGDTETLNRNAWLNYVFDVQVTSRGEVVQNVQRNKNNQSSRILRQPSSIGTRDGVKSTQVMFGLWLEGKLKRPMAYAAIEVELKKEEDGSFSPAKTPEARMACEEWAQAYMFKNSNPKDIDRLDEIFKTNWEKKRELKTSAPLAPYKVGVIWVIPVEVILEEPDFNSNCLK